MNSTRILIIVMVLGGALAGCKSAPDSESENVAQTETEPDQAIAETAKPSPAEPAPSDAVPPPKDVAAAPADATRTDSGLAFKMLKEGSGDRHPGATDLVTVVYTGWTTDGTMVDSSQRQGRPAEFGLNQVPPGLAQAVQQLVKGAKARFWIPGDLAYGEKGSEGSAFPAPDGMLVFDIELLSFKKGPTPHRVPKNVAAAPDKAAKSATGLASRVLKKGTGNERPDAESTVAINYTAWTTDGHVIDTTGASGTPATVILETVMPGLQEGVQEMVTGERRRLWIPSELAYDNRRGRPQGMIVVDVELVDIHE